MHREDLMTSATAPAHGEAGAKARLRAKMRCVWIALGIMAVGGIGAGIVAGSWNRGGEWRLPAIIVTVALLLFGIGLLVWIARRATTDDDVRFLRDDMQRRWSRSLLFFPVFALMLSWGVWHSAGKLVDGAARAMDYLTLGMVLVLVLSYLQLFTTFHTGPGFKAVHDGELARHLRSRAVLLGYGVFFCGGIAVFGLGVADPALAVRAIPLLLLWAVAVTVCSYAVMDQRAGRDG